MPATTFAARATLIAAAALLFTALFFGHGTSDGRLFWIGSLAVIAGSLVAVGGGVPLPRGARLATLALLAGLTAWVGLTLWGAIAPGLSWAAFDPLLAHSPLPLLRVPAT